MKKYPVDPADEARSDALLNAGPLIIMENISVTGFVQDGSAHVVISFHNDNGQTLNFAIDEAVADDVGHSLIMAAQRAKEINGEPGGKPS